MELEVDLVEERTNHISSDVAILKTNVADSKEGQDRFEARQGEMQHDIKAIFSLLLERLR